MNTKTREEIFAESDKRYPDYFDAKQHGLSLGFEEGAKWASTLETEPSADAISMKAAESFPVDEKTIGAEVQVAAWRRAGFWRGVQWVVEA
jgi:hypothetical protein